ncbi:MAG: putative quinol monooxygenase [Gemmataceae bacterium]
MIRSCLGILSFFLLPFLAAPAWGQQEPHPIAVQVKSQLQDPDKPFTMMVYLQVKKGTQKQFETAFAKAIEGTRKEKGCIAYDLNRDVKDPTRYIVYERWKTLKDLEEHLRTPHITQLIEEVGDLFTSPPDAKVMLPAGE